MAEPEARPSVPQNTGAKQYYDQADKEESEKDLDNVTTYPDNDSARVNGADLEELRPDYAIVVKLETGNDRDNVEKVVKQLIENGIYVQVRQGHPGQLLVLAKCSSKKVQAQLHNRHANDWLFGVRTKNPGDQSQGRDSHEDITPAERLGVVFDVITGIDNAAITPGEGEWEFIESIFPIHDYKMNKQLIKKWSTQWMVKDEDIHTIRKQFGDRIGMYFAFLRYYFWWSIIPSVVGIITHFFFGEYSTVFAVLNCLWGITFIETWKRKQRQLAIQWDVKNCSVVGQRRMEFKGEEVIKDPITDVKKSHYSNKKRSITKLAFLPLGISAGLILVLFQSIVFIIEIFLTQMYDGPLKFIANFVPTGIIVVATPIFGILYTMLVKKFTKMENHEYHESYEFSYTSKQFIFNFLTSFMALFLTAYVYLPFGHLVIKNLDFIRGHVDFYSKSYVPTATSFELNGRRLHDQVIFFVGTSQVINFALETVVPYVKQILAARAKKLTQGELVYSDHPEEQEFLNSVRSQCELPEYDVHEDYRQLVVQFGYTILFGPVWSLCPIPTMINNWVQLRGDVAKICMDSRRPVPKRAENIGPWVMFLKFLSWLGSLTCASIIAMFGNPLTIGDNDDGNEKSVQSMVTKQPWVLLLIVMVSENVYLVASKAISFLNDSVDTPESLQDRRTQYQVRRQYLDEKRSVMAETEHIQDPSEREWSSITKAQLNDQIEDGLTGPKSLKQKKEQ